MNRTVAIPALLAGLLFIAPPLWADPDKGRALFEEKGCANCHAINGEGGDVGPDLSTEGDRKDRDRAWHIAHLLDPASVVPGSTMPQLVFDEDEAGHLADYLMSLTAATAPTARLAPAVAGAEEGG